MASVQPLQLGLARSPRSCERTGSRPSGLELWDGGTHGAPVFLIRVTCLRVLVRRPFVCLAPCYELCEDHLPEPSKPSVRSVLYFPHFIGSRSLGMVHGFPLAAVTIYH